MTQGLAPSTRKVYASAKRRFLDFCAHDHRLSPSGSALPASEDALIRFCCHLADTLHHSSIKVYLSAIRSLHVEEGLPSPLVGCLRLQRVLRGIKRHQGSNTLQRQPITSELMHTIFQSLNVSDHNHTMLWAACCCGFFGFLRAGEFTVNSHFNPDIHLTVSDIQADTLVNPGSLRIFIKCSKTDPFRQGCYIYIGAGKRDLFPVRALTQYLHVRDSTPGPFFLLSNGTPLNRQWLSSSIQSILFAAGVPGCYTGHSFRIGAATSAAYRGLPDHLIKTLGRWSSDAYQIYIRTTISRGGSKLTHLTGISRLFFSPVFFLWGGGGGASGIGSSGLGLPPALSPSFPLRSGMRQLGESLRLGMGAHGWVAGICQPWGQYSI